ncbi:MAG TPA: hypothetical protein VF791_23545 [Pyrinomonadaceae bacterium]
MRISNVRFATMLFGLLVWACAFAPHAAGQDAPVSTPQERKIAVVVYDGDMIAFLGHMAGEFNITIGFEADPLRPRPRLKFEAREATLRDILDAVARAVPGYQWRESEGSIDFYPASGSNPLLDTSIKHFEVSNAGWSEASDALLNLPEVQSTMIAARLSRREQPRTAAGRGGNTFSLNLENVTLRRALHEMTKRSGNRFWIFRQDGGSGGIRFFSVGSSM